MTLKSELRRYGINNQGSPSNMNCQLFEISNHQLEIGQTSSSKPLSKEHQEILPVSLGS